MEGLHAKHIRGVRYIPNSREPSHLPRNILFALFEQADEKSAERLAALEKANEALKEQLQQLQGQQVLGCASCLPVQTRTRALRMAHMSRHAIPPLYTCTHNDNHDRNKTLLCICVVYAGFGGAGRPGSTEPV